MAAVSAPQAPSALTPPSSSHEGQNWTYSVPTQTENPAQSKPIDLSKPPLSQTNGHALPHQSSRSELSKSKRSDTFGSTRSNESIHLAPARVNALARKDSSISEAGSAPDSLIDLYQGGSGVNSVDYGERMPNGEVYDEEDPEHSRWIHRDKLARIESQELQAAGIILPRARAHSKGRREHSREQHGNGLRSEQPGQKRQRIETIPTEEEEHNGWDLRTPEEAAADPDPYKDMTLGGKGITRIPISKTSPLPIPPHHLERDTPLIRKELPPLEMEDDPVVLPNPKTRGRSQSIKVLEDSTATPLPPPTTAKPRQASDNTSPTKKTPAKKGSSARTASAQSRPKKTTVHNRDTSGQRPPTRGSELNQSNSVSKRPEGDPPWLATMYKPDPRLPPDQQLLPTVARRLQQEQWEKEGKFGNIYDTSFRPLNDELPTSPEPPTTSPTEEEPKIPTPIPSPKPSHKGNLSPNMNGGEWPLKSPSSGPRSPALSSGRPGTSGGYSTMPKIVGQPQGLGVMQNPRPILRVPDAGEKEGKDKEGGCCCAVM